MRSNQQLYYDLKLRRHSRRLRKEMTNSERRLWSRVRKKQLRERQFYRQRIIGEFIVDFYCPSSKLIIELDGGQHFSDETIERDRKRDDYLSRLGLKILRFSDSEVMKEIDAVLEKIIEYL